jgi:hypothetical protein
MTSAGQAALRERPKGCGEPVSTRPKEWVKDAMQELNEKLSHHGGSASVTGYDEDGAPIVALEHPTLEDEGWHAREAVYAEWARQYGLT